MRGTGKPKGGYKGYVRQPWYDYKAINLDISNSNRFETTQVNHTQAFLILHRIKILLIQASVISICRPGTTK